MNRTSNRRSARQPVRPALVVALALVVFLGAALQITMVARLSAQNKAIAAVQTEIDQLDRMAENYNVSLDAYHQHERVTQRAEALGMYVPTGSELRVINVPGLLGDTSTQSAENVGAEEMK